MELNYIYNPSVFEHLPLFTAIAHIQCGKLLERCLHTKASIFVNHIKKVCPSLSLPLCFSKRLKCFLYVSWTFMSFWVISKIEPHGGNHLYFHFTLRSIRNRKKEHKIKLQNHILFHTRQCQHFVVFSHSPEVEIFLLNWRFPSTAICINKCVSAAMTNSARLTVVITRNLHFFFLSLFCCCENETKHMWMKEIESQVQK